MKKKETSTRRIKYNQSKNFFSARCDIPFLFFANAELWPCGFFIHCQLEFLKIAREDRVNALYGHELILGTKVLLSFTIVMTYFKFVFPTTNSPSRPPPLLMQNYLGAVFSWFISRYYYIVLPFRLRSPWNTDFSNLLQMKWVSVIESLCLHLVVST